MSTEILLLSPQETNRTREKIEKSNLLVAQNKKTMRLLLKSMGMGQR
jgi:hypothetical protein